MQHPSTCQCGGSGFEKSSTDNPLKIPIPCAPSQKIVEWEKEFDTSFLDISYCECKECGGSDAVAYDENGRLDKLTKHDAVIFAKQGGLPSTIKDFIRSLLSSHSQALQERHEAEIARIREAIEKWDGEIAEEISAQWDVNLNDGMVPGFRAGIKCALEAFATHLNPKS